MGLASLGASVRVGGTDSDQHCAMDILYVVYVFYTQLAIS